MPTQDKVSANLSGAFEKTRLVRPTPVSTLMKYWWPIVLVTIGLLLLLPRLLNTDQEPAWLSTIGDIFGIFATLVGFILFAFSGRQENYEPLSIAEQFTSSETDFPFHIVRSLTDATNLLFPEPTGEIVLSDREIPYIPREIPRLELSFVQTGRVLVTGRSKTGKTRAVIELLRSYWKTSPTVLILKRDANLFPPAFIPPDVPQKNLVFVIDDLHNHAIECRKRKVSIGDAISNIQSFFIQYCGNQPGEVRFILISRREPECWDQLEYTNTEYPWTEFELVNLPALTFNDARQLIIEMASTAPPIKIAPDLIDNIAQSNDGTYYQLILAFRDWRNHSKKEISKVDVSRLQTDLASSWRYRQSNLFRYRPSLRYIYIALDLAQSVGIPAHKDVLALLTQLIQYYGTVKVNGWILVLRKRLGKRIQNIFLSHRTANLWGQAERMYLSLTSKLYQVIVWPFRILFQLIKPKASWQLRLRSKLFLGLYSVVKTFISVIFFLAFLTFEFIGLEFLNRYFSRFYYLVINLGFLSLIFFTLFLGWLLLLKLMHGLTKLQLKLIHESIKYISTAEIPIAGNILVPYDLQVNGAIDKHKTQSRVLDLKKNEKLSLQDVSSYAVLENWFKLADFDEIGWDIGISVGETLLETNKNDASLNFELGKFNYWKNEHTKAISFLEKAIKLDSKLPLAFLYRGRACKEIQRDTDAIESFDQALELDPSSAIALADRGLTHKKVQQYEKALADFNQAIKLNPVSAWLFTHRGWILLLVDQHKDAMSDLDRAIELDPKRDFAYLLKGIIFREIKNYDEAISNFDQALEIEPTYAAAFAQRGVTHRIEKRYAESLLDLNRAIELDAGFQWAYAQRSLTYREMGNYDKALEGFKKSLELDAKTSWIFAQYAITYSEIENYEESINNFNRAIELDSKDTWLLAQRSLVYRRMGRYEEALADIECIIELEPNDADTFAQRGITYRLMERYQDALMNFNRAIELDSKDAWILSQRGETYHLMSEYEAAMKDLNKAINLNSKYALAFAFRGQVHRLLKKYKEAEDDFSKAIEIESTHDWWYYQRSSCYFLNNNPNTAKDDLETAIRLSSEKFQNSPRNSRNAFNLALYYLAASQFEQGKQLYKDTLQKGISVRLKEEAIQDLNEINQLFPENTDIKEIKKLFE
jgi:tetratricopeptide (TPR) repeat protein